MSKVSGSHIMVSYSLALVLALLLENMINSSNWVNLPGVSMQGFKFNRLVKVPDHDWKSQNWNCLTPFTLGLITGLGMMADGILTLCSLDQSLQEDVVPLLTWEAPLCQILFSHQWFHAKERVHIAWTCIHLLILVAVLIDNFDVTALMLNVHKPAVSLLVLLLEWLSEWRW